MPFNGSGGFTRVRNWVNDSLAHIKIKADLHDSEDDNFAAGLSNTLTKDGQSQPTADIPLNGKKLVNVANPVNPQDAATKAYADSIRSFNTAITMSGAGVNSIIGYTVADLSTLTRAVDTPAAGWMARYVWNDKANGTGNDIMQLHDNASGSAVLALLGNPSTLAFNTRLATSPTSRWVAIDAGTGSYISHDRSSGSTSFAVATSGVAVGADLSLISALTLTAPGNANFYGSVSVGNGPPGSTAGNFYLSANATDRVLGFAPNVFLKWNIASGDFLLATAGGNRMYSNNANGAVSFPGTIYAACGAATTSQTYLSADGTNAVVNMGSPSRSLVCNLPTGNWTLNTEGGNRWTSVNATGNFFVPTTATKPGGGPWTDSSDERIKTVQGDYTTGLEAVKGLRPVVYTFKGNDTPEEPSAYFMGQHDIPDPPDPATVPYRNSPHYQVAVDAKEFIGMIAQEVEQVMPGMVTKRAAFIDGVEVTDLRDLDTTNLIYALVNAVKELAAKVEALEAAQT